MMVAIWLLVVIASVYVTANVIAAAIANAVHSPATKLEVGANAPTSSQAL